MRVSDPQPAFNPQPAHGTVANARPLDMSRDKGKTHLDDPPQELTFDDILDVINPLQHLPIISTIYRELTGDKIKPAMRILGDLGYGGPSGFVMSCAQVLFEAISGDDLGGHVMAMIDGRTSSAVDAKAQPAATAEPVQLVSAAGPPAGVSALPADAAATVAPRESFYRDGTHR